MEKVHGVAEWGTLIQPANVDAPSFILEGLQTLVLCELLDEVVYGVHLLIAQVLEVGVQYVLKVHAQATMHDERIDELVILLYAN